MKYRYDDSPDPLAVVTAPPPNETRKEKAARKEREAKAKRTSDRIDNALRAEGATLREQGHIVKVLLLGQSETERSTILKYLRMRLARDEWVQERAYWRAVLQLNLVHSVNAILETLQAALDDDPLPFTDKHHLLRLQLRPLCGVESDLKRLLGVTPQDTPELSPQTSPELPPRMSSESHNWRNFDAHCGRIISFVKCYEDTNFLDNAERLATRDFEPTDDDIVRARLRTLDIQEYELNVVEDGEPTRMWKIYDVGGSRTQRNVWLPYFDQVDAVIFLAPISCFDERLQEDPKVNRLEDSFILWKAICSSKLLSQTTLVVFLTNVDILRRKIESGVMVNQHLPSYGNRPNDTQSVVEYLRQQFKDIVKHNSLEPRMYHIYPTSVIDAHAAALTLLSVRDGILQAHLKRASII
ncbi:guanine nucleotide binding protein, alpha subunit [Boletus coccyginus]|nr:guanine nucleotide binding protein, alpha subunit [Boletus coccyginus]